MSDNTFPGGLLPPDDDPDFLAALAHTPLVGAARAFLQAPVPPDCERQINGERQVRLDIAAARIKTLLDDVTRLVRAVGPAVEKGDFRGIRKMDWRGPLGDAAVGALLQLGRRHFEGPARQTKTPLDFLMDYGAEEAALMADLLEEARELRKRLLEINGVIWDPNHLPPEEA